MLKLEVFDTAPDLQVDQACAKRVAAAREAAYDDGYNAGWQDALSATRDEDDQRRATALEAVQAISFTYAEAHAALETAFLALTDQLLEQLLPQAAQLGLPALLRGELHRIAQQGASLPIELHCAPASSPALRSIIDTVKGVDIRVIEEPAFSDAQVSLRLGAQQRDIDFDSLTDQIRAAFERQSPSPTKSEARNATA